MISNKILHSLNLSIKLARTKNNGMAWHFGCIIFNGKNIVGIGYNKWRTHTKANSPYRFLHAEIDAIIGVEQEKLNGSTMYLARVGYDNRAEIMFAKPCKYCQAAIIRAGIRKVYYTINNQTIGLWDVRQNNFMKFNIGEKCLTE